MDGLWLAMWMIAAFYVASCWAIYRVGDKQVQRLLDLNRSQYGLNQRLLEDCISLLSENTDLREEIDRGRANGADPAGDDADTEGDSV